LSGTLLNKKRLVAGCLTIRGRLKRGTGLIDNEPYVGRLVWNRQRYVKDPSTGRRVSRMNAESEWIVADVPELRISTTNSSSR
jgi:site-specific DNA recombinase